MNDKPIIEIIEIENIGKYAKARPVEPGELTALWASPLKGVNTTQYKVTTEVPGLEEISRQHFHSDRKQVQVTLFFPEPVKNGPNKEHREKLALIAEDVVGGQPITAPKVLKAINDEIGRRIMHFNTNFVSAVDRMVSNAGEVFTKDTFVPLRVKVATLREVVNAVTAKLREAKDELHVAARGQLLQYLQEQHLPENLLDFTELAKKGRAYDPFLGDH